MPDRDIVTWNAVLGGCSQNALGTEAIEIFEEMKALIDKQIIMLFNHT